jgi:hypothetical protein
MTDPVARFVELHAAATGTKSREYCDPFISTTWIVVELASALDLARRHVGHLQTARIKGSLAGMTAAQAELDRLLAQSRQLSETVGRVLRAHAGRVGS